MSASRSDLPRISGADQPLVSVVMVTRNVERFLVESIESILNQTFRDFEFIIVDFGSTDNSKEISRRYAASDNRIRLDDTSTCGLAEVRNAACALATGRYLAIQDADDISLPGRLKTEVAFLETHPGVGLLGGAVQWIDSKGKSLVTAPDYPTGDFEIREVLKERNPFWQPTVMMRREAFERVGGYRVALSQSEDYELWLRISEHYQCANLNEVILKYRIHPFQVSIRKRTEQILCALAAQASAALRRAKRPDPLESALEVTAAVLVSMGVTETIQAKSLAEGYSYWIKQTYAAGEYDAVLEATAEMAQVCGGRGVDPRVLSDVHLMAATAAWKQKKILSSALLLGRAIRERPRVVGRPLMPLLRFLSHPR